MSHEITSTDVTAFSEREGAGWTGLGRAIPRAIAKDPVAIAEYIGLTWTVDGQPIFVKNSKGEYVKVAGHSAQVRSDTRSVLSVTSDSRYHTQERQPVNVLEAFGEELDKENMEISHVTSLKGGQLIAVSALMNSEFDIVVGKGDLIKSYTTLSTGYDKKHGTKCTKGGIRVVCANTLAAAIALAMGKANQIRTIRASQVLEYGSLKALVENVASLVDAERTAYNQMANTAMSNEDVSRYFADVLEVNIADLGKLDKQGVKLISTKTENILKALAASYANAPGAHTASGSVWGALNACTHYATHVKTCRDTKGDGDDAARVASNLFGDAAVLKARAQTLALQRSGVVVAA